MLLGKESSCLLSEAFHCWPPLNSYPTAVVLDIESRDRDYDDSDQDSESSDDGTLIPKPNGEAGQLDQGGYNLEDALGWHVKEYS